MDRQNPNRGGKSPGVTEVEGLPTLSWRVSTPSIAPFGPFNPFFSSPEIKIERVDDRHIGPRSRKEKDPELKDGPGFPPRTYWTPRLECGPHFPRTSLPSARGSRRTLHPL